MRRNIWNCSLSLLLLVAICACENSQFRAREAGALGGAALGAGLGAIIGHQTGHAGAGVAIGSAIGALSGGLVGSGIDSSNDTLAENDRKISEQERQLEENKRLIAQLRGAGVDVHESERGVVVNLPDVLFDFNSARLTPSARDTCSDIARIINKSGDRHVSVEGHTDSIGTYEYNQRLSEHRAQSVASELLANGISRRQISTRGLGERYPVASNKSDRGRERNRRVEVVIENR